MAWGGPEFDGVRPAPLLAEPDLTAALCQRFRRLLLCYPLQFLDLVEGHPPVRLHWALLVETAGTLWLRSDSGKRDAVSVLLNGLEAAEEREVIRVHLPMLEPHWNAVVAAERPLAVNGFFKVNRLQDSAVITVLSCFANAYLTHFGRAATTRTIVPGWSVTE